MQQTQDETEAQKRKHRQEGSEMLRRTETLRDCMRRLNGPIPATDMVIAGIHKQEMRGLWFITPPCSFPLAPLSLPLSTFSHCCLFFLGAVWFITPLNLELPPSESL